MSSRYRPSGISVVSAPVTSANLRNAKNQPVTDLGCCTPFQLFAHISMKHDDTVCIIGNPARGIGIAKAMIRRSQKPFLLIGPASDRNSAFTALEPDWTMDSAGTGLPEGSGALLFSRPNSSYLEMCEYLEEWSRDRFLILHLDGGVQIGAEVLNLLGAVGQCLIICESIPRSIRIGESRTITPEEFMSRMSYLFVFSAGAATKDLIGLLPTYQYENVSNTTNVNSYKSRSIFNPFRAFRGHGASWGQTRSMEHKKSLFEMDDLQKIFDDGVMLLYDTKANTVFLARIV